MDSPDDILAPVRDRLRQQQAAIRSVQAAEARLLAALNRIDQEERL